jgi:hypothetical protein
MSFLLKEQVGMLGIALFNGIFVIPSVRRYYRQATSLRLQKEDPSHYVRLYSNVVLLRF